MSTKQNVYREATLEIFYDSDEDRYHIVMGAAGATINHAMSFEDAQDMACAILRVEAATPF